MPVTLDKLVYRIGETAQILGVSEDTIQRWIARGILEVCKTGSAKNSLVLIPFGSIQKAIALKNLNIK